MLATGANGLDDTDGGGKAEALKTSGTAEALPLMLRREVVDAGLPRPGRAGMGGRGSGSALLKMTDGAASRAVAGTAV